MRTQTVDYKVCRIGSGYEVVDFIWCGAQSMADAFDSFRTITGDYKPDLEITEKRIWTYENGKSTCRYEYIR